MSGEVKLIVGALLCGALLVSCGKDEKPASSAVPTAIAQSSTQAAAVALPAAPEPAPLAPEDIGKVMLGQSELAKALGRKLVDEKESSTPFPDQEVAPEACMTAVDIGFKRQLGEQWSSFAYYYAHTPKEEGAVEVLAEDVAIYPTHKAATAALDMLGKDLGQCSGSQAQQRAGKTQTWQITSAPVQSKRIVWTTAQRDSRNWHCDYQAQALANTFFSVMFCQRGDAGGMAASLMRAIASRVG